ncbi:MAG: hypothetical protein ACRDRA_08855 [Pseudonocardiaceae bacterium]
MPGVDHGVAVKRPGTPGHHRQGQRQQHPLPPGEPRRGHQHRHHGQIRQRHPAQQRHHQATKQVPDRGIGRLVLGSGTVGLDRRGAVAGVLDLRDQLLDRHPR